MCACRSSALVCRAFGKLYFEVDDAAGRIERCAGGDEFACTGGDSKLTARVSAVPTF